MNAVHLDVTHGFRTLPMLALMAAFYLDVTCGLTIKGVYYGMFEASDQDGVAPVVRLDGLLRFGHWIGALRQYNKDGDYAVFSTLLQRAGVASAEQLAEAAFYERITDLNRSAGKISSIFRALDGVDPEQFPAAKMFIPELKKRLDWFRNPSRAAREWLLAEEYLKRKDYLRAALIALEAAISTEIEKNGGSISDFELRRDIHDQLRDQGGTYKQLNMLRNQMAHGSRKKNRDTTHTMSNERILNSTLSRLIKQLRKSNG